MGLQESDHEWGGVGTIGSLDGQTDQTVRLGAAAHRWRHRLSSDAAPSGDGRCGAGAFRAWRVALFTDAKREANFRRLLEAGGATVLSNKYVSMLFLHFSILFNICALLSFIQL